VWRQPLGGAQGQAADIEIQAKEILFIRSLLNSYIADYTGQPIDKVSDTFAVFCLTLSDTVACLVESCGVSRASIYHRRVQVRTASGIARSALFCLGEACTLFFQVGCALVCAAPGRGYRQPLQCSELMGTVPVRHGLHPAPRSTGAGVALASCTALRRFSTAERSLPPSEASRPLTTTNRFHVLSRSLYSPGAHCRSRRTATATSS
jgi:Clp protease